MKRNGFLLALLAVGFCACTEEAVNIPPPEELAVVRQTREHPLKAAPNLSEKQIFSSPEYALETTSSDWKVVSESDGVKTWQKAIQNSNVVAFRGESLIPAPLIKIATILNSDDLRKEWVEALVEARTLEQVSKSEQIEYNRTKAPWPLQDRDFVFRAKAYLGRKPTKVLITIKSVEDSRAPPKDGVVRAEILHCFYFMKEMDGGKNTKVVLEMAVDPKGAIPNWLMNLVQKDWPKKTFRNLRKLAKRDDIRPTDEIREFFSK